MAVSFYDVDCKNPELAGFIRDKILDIQKIHNSSDPLSETKCKLCIYDILVKIGEYTISLAKKRMNLSEGAGYSPRDYRKLYR
jgi:hypothetical protein